jgi:hypothetical protein
LVINNLDLPSQLASLTQALDKELAGPSNIDEARALLGDAQKQVGEITKKANKIRITFLEEQARSLAADDDKKAA